MSVSAEPGSRLDTLKWLVVIALVGGAAWGNQHFEDLSVLIRGAAILVIAALAILVGLSTTKGRAAWELIKDSNVERRKVVWPVRQEAIRTTAVVFVFVFVVGLMLWLLDFVFIRVVGFITQ